MFLLLFLDSQINDRSSFECIHTAPVTASAHKCCSQPTSD